MHEPPPSASQASQLAGFTRFVSQALGRPPDAPLDDDGLQAFALQDFRAFWQHFLHWCGPPGPFGGDAEPVCEGDACETARFFPRLRLNYAACLLDPRVAPPEAPALTACGADGRRVRWTRGALRDRRALLAMASDGSARFELNRTPWQIASDPVQLGFGIYLD